MNERALNFLPTPEELYKSSNFFANYIENVAHDALKNGVTLEELTSSYGEDELNKLKNELKSELINCIISYRFRGSGYVLIKTNKPSLIGLEEEPISEIVTGFLYLDKTTVSDESPQAQTIIHQYTDPETKENKKVTIHKSRLIVYQNYNVITQSIEPCFRIGFLLAVVLLEEIYFEIKKRINTYSFLYLKDEALVHLQETLNKLDANLEEIVYGTEDTNLLKQVMNKLFLKKKDNLPSTVQSARNVTSSVRGIIEKIFKDAKTGGIVYSSTPSASMEIKSYDISYLREALELIKQKIGADTKEPLTRSFNEQTKGLGNEGKGDQSNYYDFLKTVQEGLEIACNKKFNKYYGLEMRFNSLIILSDEEKMEHDLQLIQVFREYKNLMGEGYEFTKEELDNIKVQLKFLTLE